MEATIRVPLIKVVEGRFGQQGCSIKIDGLQELLIKADRK